MNDPYFEGVPSLAKTRVAFHAKDDLPEIRFQVYKLLATLDFKAQFIVARKVERVFRNNGEPCLSIIDYMNWAIYRAYTRGEMRYFRVVEEKVSLLVDLYDRTSYPKNWYNRKNRFDINKITPL